MIDRAVLKRDAKAQISGSVGILIVCLLFSALIEMIAVAIPVGFVIIGAMNIAFARMHLRLSFGHPVTFDDLFIGFRDSTLLINALLANFLVMLFTALWSCLFFIPGIIKALSYSMTNYILADHPGIGAFDAFKESQRIMEGHKLDLFILQLSFIPWNLLIVATCGLATFYVTPYVQQTYANFYLTIKAAPASFPQQ